MQESRQFWPRREWRTFPLTPRWRFRVGFVFVFALAVALGTRQTDVANLNRTHWTFLALSAVATFLSWLCYFRALQLGDVARVAPIDKLSFVVAMILGLAVLREKFDPNWQWEPD